MYIPANHPPTLNTQFIIWFLKYGSSSKVSKVIDRKVVLYGLHLLVFACYYHLATKLRSGEDNEERELLRRLKALLKM